MNKFILFLSLLAGYSGYSQDTLDISFGNLSARSIGPAKMSGRITAISGNHAEPQSLYIGSANGGLWKTTSGGASFLSVFDEHTQSIGAVTVDSSHPDTIWVGTGEPWVRNSVSVGSGIYVSTNGGNSWSMKGLTQSERISRIQLRNDGMIYVGVQGQLWSSSEERGVYRSSDFGNSWEKVLYVDENTGCADLAMHPTDQNTIIAAMWDHRRTPDFFRSGGPGSGLYRSQDGGGTWSKIHNGLPTGELGRMAVAYAESSPNIVYITVEAEENGGLYRSEDGGDTWNFVNDEFNLVVRPFYFSRLVVDPNNPDKIFKCGLNLTVSEDAGQSFRTVYSGVHSDIHDVWIPNTNSNLVYIGTDGGGYRSIDGGTLFEQFMNLPLSQFYHISVDNADPYNVYGGLQDNGSWYGPSSAPGGIRNEDWQITYYGDGFFSYRHPTDPNIVYAESQEGYLVRFNKISGQSKDIQPLPEIGQEEYRFNWNSPIAISVHNPDRIYFASQYLFRSEDRGDSWEQISPDLTTNNPDLQRQKESGGISIDASGAENNTTIVAISESAFDDQVIWVGTDDGNLQVTVNGGANWTNVINNIQGLPKGLWCSSVEAGIHDRDHVFVTFDGHRSGDMNPYVFYSTNLGKTWTPLAKSSIQGYAHHILEDHVNPNLLYLGTEHGLYISLDHGISWKRFDNGIPPTSIMRLALQKHKNDLVIGTHGRGIYIIDDISTLQQITPEVAQETLHFFSSEPFTLRYSRITPPFGGAGSFVGQNPSANAQISYFMKRRHTFGRMTMWVTNSEGELIADLPPGKSGGINVVELPLRLPTPKAAPTKKRRALGGSLYMPSVPEGTYTVFIKKGRDTFQHQIQLMLPPDLSYSKADLNAQREAVLTLYTLTEQVGYYYYACEDILQSFHSIDSTTASSAATAFRDSVFNFQQSLVSLGGDFYVAEEEAAIREEISDLFYRISNYPGHPSERQLEYLVDLQSRMEFVKSRYEELISNAEQLKSKGFNVNWRTLEEYLEE